MSLFKLFVFLLSFSFADSPSHKRIPLTLNEMVEESAAIIVAKGEKKFLTYETIPVREGKLPFKKKIIHVTVSEVLKNMTPPLASDDKLSLASRFWQYDFAELYHEAQFEEVFRLNKLFYSGPPIDKLKERAFILFVFPRASALNFTNENPNQLYYVEGGLEPIEKKTQVLQLINAKPKGKD